MGETWVGLVIGGAALVIALPMVIAHYWRELRRARALRNLDHDACWHAPYRRKAGRRRSD